MSNVSKTAKDILVNAFNQMDANALEQIANHCEFNTELATKYSDTVGEKIALIKSEEYFDMKLLAAYCRVILKHKNKL